MVRQSPDTPKQPGRARAWLGRAGRAGLDAVLPPRCLTCGTIINRDGAVCAGCWSTLTFIDRPFCRQCSLPFEIDVPDTTVCGACLAHPPSYDRARAALIYDDASRPMILTFKNGDRMQAAARLAAWMFRAGADLLPEVDVVVPVPLHWQRLVSRRYNQSAELAKALAGLADLPVAADLLKRVRPTPTQGGLNPRQRRRNVRGAFDVREAYRQKLPGAHILLVDDVLTTGATVDQCARTLKRCGAASVAVLVLARVNRPAVPE